MSGPHVIGMDLAVPGGEVTVIGEWVEAGRIERMTIVKAPQLPGTFWLPGHDAAMLPTRASDPPFRMTLLRRAVEGAYPPEPLGVPWS